MKKYFFQWILVAWILVVLQQYYHFHPEYLKAYKKSPDLFVGFFITMALIYWIYILYKNYIEDKNTIYINKSPLVNIWIWAFSFFTIVTLLYTKSSLWEWITYFKALGSVFSKIFPVFLKFKRLEGVDGEPVGAIGSMRDMTAEKMLSKFMLDRQKNLRG